MSEGKERAGARLANLEAIEPLLDSVDSRLAEFRSRRGRG